VAVARPLVLRVDPDNPSRDVMERAAATAREGGLIVYPTDTVYGLGTNPLIASSVKRVYEVKERPLTKPLPVLVSSVEAAKRLVRVTPEAECLMRLMWPGALTIILPTRPGVPPELHAGTGKLGVRMPAHRVALLLIELSGGALIGTSANKHGRPSPHTAEEAIAQLDGSIDVVVDAGPAPGGVPSTVIELIGASVRVVRPGPVSLEEVTRALGKCNGQRRQTPI